MFAPHSNTDVQHQLRMGLIPTPLPLVLGGFTETEFGHFFEYAERRWHDDDIEPTLPHIVYVGPFAEARLAKVLKTVAYVLTDAGMQKWDIKQHRIYPTEWVRA